MKPLYILTVVSLCLVGLVFSAPEPAADFFPYVKGRYWLYDGNVKFIQDQQVIEKKITGWKSEVLDTVSGKDFKAALVKGSVNDLTWYQEGRERGLTIIILTNDGKFSEISGEKDTEKKFTEIKSTGKLPADLISSADLSFNTTMKIDDRFGDPEQVKLGTRYCWVVSNILTDKLKPVIKGIPADKEFTSYILTYQSSPDHTIVRFTTGLGITDFQYVHHGTPGDCELRLVETGELKPEL